MPLVSFGLNHKTTPLSLRERLSFSTQDQASALKDLLKYSPVSEAVLLSTCNRTEVYADTGDEDLFRQWLTQQRSLDDAHLHGRTYCHQGGQAIAHVLRVASGLDSMMLGEPQIFGQIKQSYFSALETGCIGQQLKRLFPWVFSTTKKIRSDTEIGRNPLSMAYAIVQLAKDYLAGLSQRKVLLVGAGDMIELVATHLQQSEVHQLIIANRTVEKATELARPFNAHAIRIGDIPAYLHQVDMVISATASQLPLVGKGMVESALKQRQQQPLLLVDLAVPRDIEPEVKSLPGVRLLNVDDLQQVAAQNLQSRETAAAQAETMVAIQVQHYMQSLKVMDAGQLIKQFRVSVEQERDQEVAEALRQLQRGQDPSMVVMSLARSLTGRFLHSPTQALRTAAYGDQLEVFNLIKKLYQLS